MLVEPARIHGSKMLPRRFKNKPQSVVESKAVAAVSSQTAHEKFTDDNVLDLGNANGIVIKEMTIPYGSSNLLVKAEVKFPAGSIYGIVARNGLGKSALLHRLDMVKISVPKLLVKQEQELENQDLTPFDAVKNSHVELVTLEKRFAKLSAKLDKNENDDVVLDEYERVQDRLDELEVDKQDSIIKKILHGLGFTNEHLQMNVSQLSGGWRKRVVIAAAIYCKPDFLMLDEPTNHLDLEAVLWLERYLLEHYGPRWNSSIHGTKRARTLIVISHNAEFMQTLCQTMVTIEKAKLHYYPNTTYEEFLDKHRARMTSPLVVKDEKKTNAVYLKLKTLYDLYLNDPSKCTPKHFKAAGVSEYNFKITFDILEARRSGEYDDQKHREFLKEYNNNTPAPVIFPLLDPGVPHGLGGSQEILEITDLSFSYTGKKPLFNISLTVELGVVICVCGANGTGKSTFLKLIADRTNARVGTMTGTIEVHDGIRIGYYSQHVADQLEPTMSALDYIALVGKNSPGYFKNRTDIYELLTFFGIPNTVVTEPSSSLSGGQKARVVLAGLCVLKPHLIILDEPTNHLDSDSIQALADTINKSTNMTFMIITHDPQLVNMIDDDKLSILVLQDGELGKYDGTMDEYKEELLSEMEF